MLFFSAGSLETVEMELCTRAFVHIPICAHSHAGRGYREVSVLYEEVVSQEKTNNSLSKTNFAIFQQLPHFSTH